MKKLIAILFGATGGTAGFLLDRWSLFGMAVAAVLVTTGVLALPLVPAILIGGILSAVVGSVYAYASNAYTGESKSTHAHSSAVGTQSFLRQHRFEPAKIDYAHSPIATATCTGMMISNLFTHMYGNKPELGDNSDKNAVRILTSEVACNRNALIEYGEEPTTAGDFIRALRGA